MPLTNLSHKDGDEYVTEEIDTGNQTAKITGHVPYRLLSVSVESGQVTNDGADTETVTVQCLSNLEMVSDNRETVLSYDGYVTVTVDGQQTTKTLTNGSVSFDLSTDKSAGSEIEVEAESLADHPAEPTSATIEVVSQ